VDPRVAHSQPAIPRHRIPFEQLVSEATRFTRAQRKAVDGKETIVVELFFEGTKTRPSAWDIEIQFDPTVNYLVRKVSYTTSGVKGRFRREDEVAEFKECTPGVFFPERARGQSGPEGGDPDFTYSVVFSDVQVNEPLPDDVFRFRYPKGVYLTDSIRGTVYRVDAVGNRTSPETPMGKIPPPPEEEPALQPPGQETQEEPRPATRWILPVSLGILTMGGILFVLRRWRSAAQS
jgi:hypothetical protein